VQRPAPYYVWAQHLDRVAKSLGIDEKHLTVVLLIGAIIDCICKPTSRTAAGVALVL
jgi:hypothetical protein